MYLACVRMPGESYRRRLRSLFLYLCYVFWALINSLVCLFYFKSGRGNCLFYFRSGRGNCLFYFRSGRGNCLFYFRAGRGNCLFYFRSGRGNCLFYFRSGRGNCLFYFRSGRGKTLDGYRERIAQLVERPTEKTAAKLRWVRFLIAARDFSPTVSFHSRLSYGVRTMQLHASKSVAR